jgi:hypothetical protein
MKQDCIASLSTSLTSTSRWRLGLEEKHPDHRNARSAKLLAKLASKASSLTDEHWTALEPHFESAQWHEALRQTSRLVGFAVKKMSLQFYLRSVVRVLEEPATAA